MTKFEFYHYPRKYGKTHKLVDEMYDFIYKTNAKKVLVYVNDNEQVEYLSDVITCNLDYQYEHTKRYKGKSNNKFVCTKKDVNYVIIVGTYKFFGRGHRASDKDVELVLFDELLYENSFKKMEHIFKKYPKATMKAFYTSTIGPFNKTIFHMFLLKRCGVELFKKMEKYYSMDFIMEELLRLKGTIYDYENIDYIIKEKVAIDKFDKYMAKLNENDKAGISTVHRVFSTEKNSMLRNYFGILLTNEHRENRIKELYENFNL